MGLNKYFLDQLQGKVLLPSGRISTEGIEKTMELPKLDAETIDRIIEMAWEDRTTFESIELQFGLTESQIIALMRREMKAASFRMWRQRVTGRTTKHAMRRDFIAGRFKSPNQKG